MELDEGLKSFDLSSLGEFKTVNLDDDEESSIVFKNQISEEDKKEDKSIGLNLDDNCTIKTIKINPISETSNLYSETDSSNSEIDLTELCSGTIKKKLDNDIDINLLSRKLNKTVKDSNIKYITVNPNLDFAKVSKKK